MMDIDRIARQLVDAEPSADLEARIRARLDLVQTAGRTMSWWLWRVGAPLGAAAAVALALAVQGPESGGRKSTCGGAPNRECGASDQHFASSDIAPISPLRQRAARTSQRAVNGRIGVDGPSIPGARAG